MVAGKSMTGIRLGRQALKGGQELRLEEEVGGSLGMAAQPDQQSFPGGEEQASAGSPGWAAGFQRTAGRVSVPWPRGRCAQLLDCRPAGGYRAEELELRGISEMHPVALRGQFHEW